jgi:hypothetical protein
MTRVVAVLVVCAALACAGRTAGPMPTRGAGAPSDPALAEQVKRELLHAWNGYKQYAWGDRRQRARQRHQRGTRDELSASQTVTPVHAFVRRARV